MIDRTERQPQTPSERLQLAVDKSNAAAPPLAMRILRNATQSLLALQRDGIREISIAEALDLLDPDKQLPEGN